MIDINQTIKAGKIYVHGKFPGLPESVFFNGDPDSDYKIAEAALQEKVVNEACINCD